MARKPPQYEQLGLKKVGPGKYQDASGRAVSERQYRKLLGKPAKQSPGYKERPKSERHQAAATRAKRKPSALGNAKERRAIPDNSTYWTPRQRDIVRNFIAAHPYDATLDAVRGRQRVDSYDMPEQKTLYNLEQKLDVLTLKRDAGVLTEREYQRQYKAVERIANRISDVYAYPVGSPQYRRAVDAIAKDYEILRSGSTPEKRLVMTKEEWRKHRNELDNLDIYHEIFYH